MLIFATPSLEFHQGAGRTQYPCSSLLCSIIIIFVDSLYSSTICAKCPTIFLYLAQPQQWTCTETHCAALFSIANNDSLDGFFWHTLAALPHACSINYCCLELYDIIRNNKHVTAMKLVTRSTISRGLLAKNFTIKGWHHCCLIFCWVKEMN